MYNIMPIDYSNGKVYKLVCNKTGMVYIGSTTKDFLSQRLASHRQDYNKYLKNKHGYMSSFEIIKNDNYYITLLELWPCNSKDELLAKERQWFDKYPDCINIARPKATAKERKEKHKEYQIEYKKQRKYCDICKVDNRIDHYLRHCRRQTHINNLKKLEEQNINYI
jgi:GIY-YIG catalytic domain